MKKVDLWFLFIDKFRCQRATLEKFITKNSDATKKGEELSENVLKIFNVRLFFLLTKKFLALFFVLFFSNFGVFAWRRGNADAFVLLFSFIV